MLKTRPMQRDELNNLHAVLINNESKNYYDITPRCLWHWHRLVSVREFNVGRVGKAESLV